MNIRPFIFLSLFFISVVIAIVVFPHIQYPAVSHWGANGTPDGFILPFWAAAFGPIALGIMIFLWWILPKIDPLKKNVEEFRSTYDTFWIVFALFMFYIYVLTLFWNTGRTFNMNVALAPAFSLLVFVIGYVLPRTKRNWFMGIRTPWTLASDTVWKKTHNLGGKLFMAAAPFTFFAFIFPAYFPWLLLIPLFIATLVPMAYSYIIYKNTHE